MPHAPWPLATTTAISWRPYVDGLALRDIEVLDGAGPQAPLTDVGLALVDRYLLPYELRSCASSNENG